MRIALFNWERNDVGIRPTWGPHLGFSPNPWDDVATPSISFGCQQFGDMAAPRPRDGASILGR